MMTDDRAGFRPLDVVTLVYVLLEAAIVMVFLRSKPMWPFLFGMYIAAAAMTALFASVRVSGSFWRSLRLIYPMLIVVFLYEAIGDQVFILHRAPFDSLINSVEMSLLGFDSSFVLQRFFSVPLNEVMSLSYISYYFIPPAALILFLVYARWRALERSVLAASVTFYVCYLIFILFPAMGPRVYLANIYYLPLTGPLFTPLAQTIVARGGLHGGAMPSSHCGVALVILWFLSQEFKRFRILFYAILASLCVSTIYGRYHYLSDVVIGLLIGALSIGLTSRWQNGFFAGQGFAAELPEAEVEDAVGAGVDG